MCNSVTVVSFCTVLAHIGLRAFVGTPTRGVHSERIGGLWGAPFFFFGTPFWGVHSEKKIVDR